MTTVTPPKRGLGALLAATTHPVAPGANSSVTAGDAEIKSIRANSAQPRTQFDEGALAELAESIKSRGLIQPVVVRPVNPPEGDVRYELIAGERRWRASQLAGLTRIPIVVKEVFDNRDILLLSLVENLQRDDLNAVEEALAYDRLSKSFNLTHEQIANGVGKSRVYITNAIRILELPASIIDAIRAKKLSVGHAKVLLSIPDEKMQAQFAAKAQAEGMSVRELERLTTGTQVPEDSIESTDSTGLRSKRKRRMGSAQVQDLERRLREHFGTRVVIEEGMRKGRMVIEFYSTDDLNRIIGLLDLE